MPIENERKYVLSINFDAALLVDWARIEINQAYMDDGPRIRQYGNDFIFTYKKFVPLSKELVEIETAITRDDFNLLWSMHVEALTKTRYTKRVGEDEWVVDFLFDAAGQVYFIMAEVEMPRYQAAPEHIPTEIADHIVYVVAPNDNRFTNKKLSDQSYAQEILATILP